MATMTNESRHRAGRMRTKSSKPRFGPTRRSHPYFTPELQLPTLEQFRNVTGITERHRRMAVEQNGLSVSTGKRGCTSCAAEASRIGGIS